MNTPIATLLAGTDPLRGALRPCATSTRPIPYPEITPDSRIVGHR
jgi:hypothetical protein